MAAELAKRARPHEVVSDSSDDEDHLAKKLFAGNNMFLRDADSDSHEMSSEDEEDQTQPLQVNSTSAAAVWHDDDDDAEDEIVIPKKHKFLNQIRTTDSDAVPQKDLTKRLRDAYSRGVSKGKSPKWAKIDPAATYDSDDEVDKLIHDVTRSAGSYLVKSERVAKDLLQLRKLQDIAVGNKDSRPINIVKFHRSKPVLITASCSGILRLFQVDTEVKKEHFLQSVQYKKFPITSCEFGVGGSTLILGSRSQDYFMKYNMDNGSSSQLMLPKAIPQQNCGHFVCSRDGSLIALVGGRGQVYMLTTNSMEHLHTFSAPSNVVSLQFLPGSNDEIWALTERGEVFVWSLRDRTAHSFLCAGMVKGTSLKISTDGQILAIGHNTGIVSVYDVDEARHSSDPKTQFEVKNLVTAAGMSAFSHDEQIMAISSPVKSRQVRFVHMASQSTFQNFPTITDRIPNVTCIDFSPRSAYFAIGCDTGALFLYRLEHYQGY